MGRPRLSKNSETIRISATVTKKLWDDFKKKAREMGVSTNSSALRLLLCEFLHAKSLGQSSPKKLHGEDAQT